LFASPEAKARIEKAATAAREAHQRLLQYFVWLNAGGVGATLTFAGHLIGAGRPGWIAAPTFILFALGLSAIGVRYISEYSLAIAAFTVAMPGLKRHLHRRRLKVAATGSTIRLIDGTRALRTSSVCAIICSQVFFVFGVVAGFFTLLFA
jgi:hypothetical protein